MREYQNRGGGRQSEQQRDQAPRIELTPMQSADGVEGPDGEFIIQPGGTYFHGTHYASKLGLLCTFEPETQLGPDGKEVPTGRSNAVLYECGPITGLPLGAGLVMTQGIPMMAGLPGGIPGLGGGPQMMSPLSNMWNGNGWILSAFSAGLELRRQEMP